MMKALRRSGCAAGLAAATLTVLAVPAAQAAGEAIAVPRQAWSFAGIAGKFDDNQLQRGFKVYKEVCASCHGLKRIAFRNLAEVTGPHMPEEGVKALAASYKVTDGPNDSGAMFERPAKLSDTIPSPFKNEQEARSIHNGAYPPDLSLITKARNVEYTGPIWYHPIAMLKDIAAGYQEGGTDYTYALLLGYEDPPASMAMGEGMNYNKYFPGYQIAMPNPFAGGDGLVTYDDGTPATVDNYARDVSAFLAWAGDPKLEARKQLGWQVLLYVLIMTVLLYIGKRRLWSKIAH